MIVLGAVLPHPPILLPQIAQGREVHVQATLDAYKAVARSLQESNVQRLVLISIHGIVTLNRFHILQANLTGDFERFGHPGLTFERETDQQLVETIVESAKTNEVPLTPTPLWEQSDHSVGVPITLLEDALPDQIAIVSISFRPPADHYQLGQSIGEALSKFSEPTAIIASGDAVHRLNEDSPKGPHPKGQEVQQQCETALTNWDHENLIAIEEQLRRDVDESVISPTLILMGALEGQDLSPRILCTEHPWGVGYVTALVSTQPGSSSPFQGELSRSD